MSKGVPWLPGWFSDPSDILRVGISNCCNNTSEKVQGNWQCMKMVQEVNKVKEQYHRGRPFNASRLCQWALDCPETDQKTIELTAHQY
jgi:hypothetical protein